MQKDQFFNAPKVNNCSDGTEVATTQRYLCASLPTLGYKC